MSKCKKRYCVIIYEKDFLYYHILLMQLQEEGNHQLVEMVGNVSEDMAKNYMLTIIYGHNLKDDVQIMNRVYVNGEHKETLYKTIKQYKQIYEIDD